MPETDATWSNWSGSVTCQPDAIATPRDEDELKRLVAGTPGRVRVRGTGHSFTPVCATDGLLLDLSEMGGVFLGRSGSSDAPVARLNAGRTLNSLSKAMQAEGLAFRNLGDIDVQTLAGATMTGTHGTGKDLPCIAAEIRAVRLLTAGGEIVEASQDDNPDLLNAVRISLGTLGILLQAEIAVKPAYKLRRQASARRLDELLADAPALWERHRHFEFFALPFCDHALSIIHDETTGEDIHEGAGDDEQTMVQLRRLRDLTKRLPWLRRKVMNAVARGIKPEIRVADSWRVLSNVRNTRFHEMEYHLPVNHGLEALAEVIALIERERPDVFFPIECRMTAGDTAWLSPFQGGPRISVAIHAHQPDDYSWFIERAEPLFRARGGRPHWGKLHSLTAGELTDLYPDFQRFQALRREVDPGGRFLNPHLAGLFGESLD